MAVQRYANYQYETSPRKIEPEYNKTRKKYPTKSTAPRKKLTSKKAIIRKKGRTKLVIALFAVFASIFTISYRSSQIDAAFTQNEKMKQAYLAIEKENDQMKVDIENSLNYNNIAQQAKELLGMQNLSNKQTVYINLPKKDYIQPATESVKIEKEETLGDKILNKLKDMFE